MPRKARIQFEGARYHVMSRGNRREFILGDDDDKKLFLETLEQTCDKMKWVVHAYVLMGNHFHILLETPWANLSEGMRWLQGTYGMRYNRRHGLVGHVWQGRYKSPLISDEEEGYFRTVSQYIHLNPARAQLLSRKDPKLRDYPWSSFPKLIGIPSKRPFWLSSEDTLRSYALPKDDATSRRKYRDRMESLAKACIQGELTEEDEEARKQLERGWYIGEKSYRDKLEDALNNAVEGRKKGSLVGAAKNAGEEQRAQQIIKSCCNQFEISLEDLKGRRHNSWEKQMVAAVLQKTSGMSYNWIIKELNMGSRSSVYNALRAVEDIKGRKRRSEWKQILELSNSLH